MFIFDYITKGEHNAILPQISDHPYRILINGGSRSGKTNSLFNLINCQPDIDKIHLFAKDPCEPKYWFLINGQESAGLKHLNHYKAFFEYSNDMDDIFKNIEEYNPNKNLKHWFLLLIWLLIWLIIKKISNSNWIVF